jgi:DNA-binding transcriptional MocR family regulator
MLNSHAWRALDPVSRAAYVEMAQAYDGSNNGRIVMSARMLADRLGVSKDTAAAKLRTLETAGFIDTVKQAAFSMKIRHSAEYRLTAFHCDVTRALPSKTFMKSEPECKIRSDYRDSTVRPKGPMA